jgi:hypothetical protein
MSIESFADEPLSEYQTLALSIHLVNGKVDELAEEIRVSNAQTAEMLELFKGAKATVAFVRGAGKFTIGFSLFGGAVASLYMLAKLFILALIKGFRP